MRYLKSVAPGLWLTDTRHPESPYSTAFFHDSNLPDGVRPTVLPSRNFVFEMELAKSERGGGVQAINIELMSKF
jgi:hypothetical protein